MIFRLEHSEEKNRVKAAFNYPSIKERTAEAAYPLVLAYAGASLNRDVIDQRIVRKASAGVTTHGNHGHIDTPADVGGWPEYGSKLAPTETDRDGIPDEWEIAYNLNPPKSADRNEYDLDADYTHLEMYLSSIVIDSYPTQF